MRIGLSIREINVNGKETFILYKRYIKYFKDEEIIMILPNQSEDILSLCDAFILTGGDDLNPQLYNEKNINSNLINDEIDKVDLMIINHAFKYNKKLLGICRGIQSINIFFGGTLKQHITNHMSIEHKLSKKNNSIIHNLEDAFITNSFHHQSIKELGNGLIATYLSDDDNIEIIEHVKGNIIGVQFHPEINPNEISKKIYDFLYLK